MMLMGRAYCFAGLGVNQEEVKGRLRTGLLAEGPVRKRLRMARSMVQSPLTELQKAKLIHMFELIDTDGNGVLEFADFQEVIDFLAEERGWDRSNRHYMKLVGTNRRLWRSLLKSCNLDADKEVSLMEWLAYHVKIFTAEDFPNPEFQMTLSSIADFFFQMMDVDGDGMATRDDYTIFCQAYGLPEQQALRIYHLLDRDGNGSLSRDEVLALVREFYLSDDPEAPGNLFFGEF